MRKVSFWMVATVVVSLGISALAHAESKERFGMAGCGLGSLLFGDTPDRASQVLAGTTNGTSGTQTFGITTGTSNCNPKSGPAGAKLFIETNREALARDASRGSGETIAGLAAISGCRNPSAVGMALQRNFAAIFPSAGVPDEQVSSTVIGILVSDPSLACEDLI